MNTHRAPMRAGGTTLAQWTDGTDLGRKVHHASRGKGHFLLVGTTQGLLLPVQLKGRLGEARAIAYGPGLARDVQVSRPFAHPATAQVGAVDVQFAHLHVLASQISTDRV